MGRKPKDGSLAAPIAGRKRRRPEHAGYHWASLASDIVQLVSDRLLDGGDIADYVRFRAVCSHWRACTESIDLRAESLIVLCDGDAVWPEDAREIALFHTRTARRFRVRLPKLRGYRVVGFSAGLLVLLHKSSAEVRVLHPFSRVAVDLPSVASVYREAIRHRSSFRAMRASVCSAASSSSSIAVVIWFPYMPVVVAAEAGSDHWDILHRRLFLWNTLVFQGRLYATLADSFEIVQLYPPTSRPPAELGLPAVVAHVPNVSRHRTSYDILLAESDGTMLLVVRHGMARANLGTEWWGRQGFKIYAADLNNHGRSWKLTPVRSLGDRALFLSNDGGCMSVSARDLPSLNKNSIYFSVNSLPVLMHSLTTGLSENLSSACQIHDGKERIRPSVRPFTIADHLLTFCHPYEWTRGLMFHEHHVIPESFTELQKNIKAKESQQRFRNTPRNLPSMEMVKLSRAESNNMLAESNKRRVEANRELEDAAMMLAESTVEASRKLEDALMGLVCTMKQVVG